MLTLIETESYTQVLQSLYKKHKAVKPQKAKPNKSQLFNSL